MRLRSSEARSGDDSTTPGTSSACQELVSNTATTTLCNHSRAQTRDKMAMQTSEKTWRRSLKVIEEIVAAGSATKMAEWQSMNATSLAFSNAASAWCAPFSYGKICDTYWSNGIVDKSTRKTSPPLHQILEKSTRCFRAPLYSSNCRPKHTREI